MVFVASAMPAALARRNTTSPATRNRIGLAVMTAIPMIAPYPTTIATTTATNTPIDRRSQGRDFLLGAGADDDFDPPSLKGTVARSFSRAVLPAGSGRFSFPVPHQNRRSRSPTWSG